MSRILAYLRTSTDKQDLNIQKVESLEYARRQGFHIDELIRGGVRIIVIKQNLTLDKDQDDIQSLTMITLLSLFAEMERMMISKRTKEALAARKAQGVILGKPNGTIQDSIYDKDRDRIIELLQMGVSARRISAKHLGYGTPSSLNYYVRTRNFKTEADVG